MLIEAGAAASGTVADHLVTTGTLESESQADIMPETTGVVRRIYVEEGDYVRAGQALAEIVNPSLAANADRATLEREKAEAIYAQTQRLHAEGAVSDQDLKDAEGALMAAKTTYSEAISTAGFRRIETPISGTVSIRELRIGAMAGAQRAFQVVDLDRLRVVVQLPEKDLPRVATSQLVVLTGAYDDDASATGSVQRISPVVDPQTGTVRVTIAVDPGQEALRPGQFVKVQLEVDRHDDVLTIPRRALVWQDGEPIAWVVEDAPPPEVEEDSDTGGDPEEEAGFFAKLFSGDDDAPELDEDGKEIEPDADPWEGIPRRHVRKARLELGYTDTDLAEVIEGLTAGEFVVTVGNANLRDETLVRLPDDPNPPKKKDKKRGESEDGDAAAGDKTDDKTDDKTEDKTEDKSDTENAEGDAADAGSGSDAKGSEETTETTGSEG